MSPEILLREQLIAPNTLKAYRHDWKQFTRFCQAMEVESLPASPATVKLYLADLIRRGRKIATAIRRTSGITWFHRAAGLETPVNESVWTLLDAAQRQLRETPKQARPLTLDQLRSISERLWLIKSRAAWRDRAIVVLGWTSLLRRSSLAELLLSDLSFTADGLIITVRFEKQDQFGRGREIGIPSGKHPHTNAAGCVFDWLEHGRYGGAGPLFTNVRVGGLRGMSPAAIGRAVKNAVELIGLDPRYYTAHSMRSGGITAMGESGAGEFLIAAQSGHKSMEELRKYFRRTQLFRANALNKLDL